MSTNVQFLMELCAHPELLKGNVHTGFIEEHKNDLLVKNPPKPELISQVKIYKLMLLLWTNYNILLF